MSRRKKPTHYDLSLYEYWSTSSGLNYRHYCGKFVTDKRGRTRGCGATISRKEKKARMIRLRKQGVKRRFERLHRTLHTSPEFVYRCPKPGALIDFSLAEEMNPIIANDQWIANLRNTLEGLE